MENKEKIKISREGIKKLLGVFKFILPYKGLFILGLILLFLSTFLVLSFPIISGKLLDVASGEKWVISTGDLLQGISKKQQEGGYVIENVTQIAFLLMGILVIQSIVSFLRVYVFARVTERSIADMRKELFSKYMQLPMKYFDNNRVGDILSRITSDISLLQETLSVTSAELFRQFSVLLVGLGFIFYVLPDLSLFMLAIFPGLILLTVFFGKAIKKLSKKVQTELAGTNVIVEETVSSIPVVKAFTNEDFEIKRYSASVDSVVGVALKSATYRGAFISFIIMSMFGAIVAIMWKGGQLVAADVISPGDLITFVFVTVFIGASIAGIGDMFGQVQRAIGASERVLEILNQDSEPFYGDGSTEKINLSGDIEFNQVFFKYEDHGKYVIENLNFHVKEGERIALVGPSGAGKSTIIQLLMRFYTIDKGMVKIHGKNVYDFPLKEYRKNIGLVSQEVMLFGGSIRENIGYGKSNATEEEIIEAAKKAYAWDFIDKLPEGLNTIVGERGVKLSGGQKQRLAIARVILKNPSILILDEATSALDVESEHYVQLALEELMKDRTTIIIAHRLSTIRKVDKIMVINEGKVEESGSHDELMLLNGLYSNLVNIQFQEG